MLNYVLADAAATVAATANGSGTGADVKKHGVIRGYGHQGPEQNAVCVDLHGAAFIYDLEFLETECAHGIC